MKTEEIKAKLQSEKVDVQQMIEQLKKDDPINDPDFATDNAAVDTDVREQEGHLRIEAEIKTLSERLVTIDEALERIEKGRYGYCKRCNKDIQPKRLELIPESIYCVSCESELKK